MFFTRQKQIQGANSNIWVNYQTSQRIWKETLENSSLALRTHTNFLLWQFYFLFFFLNAAKRMKLCEYCVTSFPATGCGASGNLSTGTGSQWPDHDSILAWLSILSIHQKKEFLSYKSASHLERQTVQWQESRSVWKHYNEAEIGKENSRDCRMIQLFKYLNNTSLIYILSIPVYKVYLKKLCACVCERENFK